MKLSAIKDGAEKLDRCVNRWILTSRFFEHSVYKVQYHPVMELKE